MVEGKTASGFAYKVDEDAIDDMDFMENLAKLESGSLVGAMNAVKCVLGDEQKEALKAHLKELHGHARFSDFMKELTEIIEAVPTLKNS